MEMSPDLKVQQMFDVKILNACSSKFAFLLIVSAEHLDIFFKLQSLFGPFYQVSVH
jgi:hypothetical protein